jgi:CRP-like cAMP-binding protein
MKKKYLELLITIPLFKNYTVDMVKDFLECNTCRVSEYERGDVVLVRGEKVKDIGIVLSGSLVGQIESRDGTATTINYLEKGSVFGDVLSGSSGTSPVTIIARSKCKILWLELSKVLAADSNDNNRLLFLQNYIREISNKYFSLHERVQILSERKMKDKIMAYFTSLSIKQSNNEIMLPQHTRNELANYLGCDRSALTRELSNMQRKGQIEINKRKIKINKLYN